MLADSIIRPYPAHLNQQGLADAVFEQINRRLWVRTFRGLMNSSLSQ
jgi:hypothetical protein